MQMIGDQSFALCSSVTMSRLLLCRDASDAWKVFDPFGRPASYHIAADNDRHSKLADATISISSTWNHGFLDASFLADSGSFV